MKRKHIAHTHTHKDDGDNDGVIRKYLKLYTDNIVPGGKADHFQVNRLLC